MAATAGIVAQLRALRQEQHKPLKVVAHDVGVSLWWISQIECGPKRCGGVELLERWARALGAEVRLVPTKATARKRHAA